jgi:lipopolysaccharide/colanic/teichoic acid biosynthesis glycosyltransferase
VTDVSTMKSKAAPEPKRQAVSFANGSSAMASFLSEDHFRRMLSRERKRSERSRKHLVLMLIDGKGVKSKKTDALLEQIAVVLGASIRETDLAGWFETNAVFGVIFTEFGQAEVSTAVKIIEGKITAALQGSFKVSQLNSFQISFYAFPDGWDGNGHARAVDEELYPDLFEVEEKKKLSLLVKRTMDICGAATALTILAPAFLALAALVKLTSKGPVFFRQQRVGRYGLNFEFLKFRSMYVSTDAAIHKEYVRNFIAGKTAASADTTKKTVYKITNDPRVTWIGKIMRRTSLDEIPQFWNVLRGEMSIVGPRPERPEFLDQLEAEVPFWTQRLLLRPGITGWAQIRAAYAADALGTVEKLSYDLWYLRHRSIALDTIICLKTLPRMALLRGAR